MPDRRSISYDAKNVWHKYFDERQDVEHKPLPEDLFTGSMSDRKKYLRQYKEENNENFLEHSMNSDLNIHGINLKKEFYKILEKNNMNFKYTFSNNTDELLKENLKGLSKIEIKLLGEREFNILQIVFQPNIYIFF